MPGLMRLADVIFGNFMNMAEDEIFDLRKRIYVTLCGCLIVVALSGLINYGTTYCGVSWLGKAVNIIGFYVVCMLWFWFLGNPHALCAIFLAGIISGGRNSVSHPIEQGVKYYDDLGRFFGNLFLFLSIFMLFNATIPIGRNFSSLLISLVAGTVLVLSSVLWKMTTKIGKKFVRAYALIVLILSLLSVIDPVAWKNSIGFDLFAFTRISGVEAKVSSIEEKMREGEDRRQSAILKTIEKKIDRGEVLTSDETAFLLQKKRERDANTIPGKVKAAFDDWTRGSGGQNGGQIKPSSDPIINLNNPGTHTFTINAGRESEWIDIGGHLNYTLSTQGKGYSYWLREKNGGKMKRISTDNNRIDWNGPTKIVAEDKYLLVTITLSRK